MKSKCTPSSYRRITLWEHESVRKGVQRRLDKTPDAMKIRRRRRTCLRNVHALDELYALPDAQAAQCRYRDGFKRTRLHSHASAEKPGLQEDNEGDVAGGCVRTRRSRNKALRLACRASERFTFSSASRYAKAVKRAAAVGLTRRIVMPSGFHTAWVALCLCDRRRRGERGTRSSIASRAGLRRPIRRLSR